MKTFKQIIEEPNYVYHRTSSDNISSIKKQGLKPKTTRDHLFLAGDLKHSKQYGGENSILLRLHRKHLPKGAKTGLGNHYWTRQTVASKHLEKKTNNSWSKL